ncbi:hypothetical protein ACIQZB_19275 [Streptomyces sp. NPDC097727]|uniref:hypothetical protein n=1 Tax=Streptomyces sp. NPDC097727 TaxID=3366092 RepID=UPI0038158775
MPTVVPVSSDFRDVRAAGRILGPERTTRRAVATGYFTEEGARCRLHHLSSCPFLAAMTLHIAVAESWATVIAPLSDLSRAAPDARSPGVPLHRLGLPPWATSGGSLPTASRPRPEGY